ncbi:MAG: EutN/CcmL family microcompartment protein [Defluviitaleaceae bacterium]|nr:EutN/CcmL family microcompartment protein [Defluviitaleaceae bacterium]
MIVCEVIGSIISTRKNEQLSGCKFMVVRPAEGKLIGEGFVAIDNIGAGIGERVLVVRGSAARLAANAPTAPIDAAIVGIIDEGTY